VPKQIADCAEWRALTFEFDREGVAKCVSMHALLDARPPSKSRKKMPDIRRINRAAVEGAEDRRTTVDSALPPHIEPASKQCSGS
jgi:hypothetical protein